MGVIDFKNDWLRMRRELKNRYPDLTDDDLRYEEGGEEDLYQRLQTRLSKSRDQIDTIFKNL